MRFNEGTMIDDENGAASAQGTSDLVAVVDDDPTARRLMDKDPLYFGSKYVEFCASWDDSRRLNYLNGPMVIIASSGMCE